MKINFYYDETSHSRSITKETILANNFFELFICAFVGITEDKTQDFENAYLAFETKYKEIYSVSGELKSNILKPKKFNLGLKSFRDGDLNFLNDYLDILINFNAHLFIACFNKLSFLIRQIFKNDKIDIKTQKMWTYSITKAISVNKDESIIESLFEKENLKEDFKKFLEKIIEKTKNDPVKNMQNQAFKNMIAYIDEFSIDDFNVDWSYLPQFFGFVNYIKDLKVELGDVIIDREERTFETAKWLLKSNAKQKDSVECVGIRASDIFCGFIFKFVSAMDKFIKQNKTLVDGVELGILDEQWFNIDEKRFNLYKKIKKVIVDLNKCWYKTWVDSNVDEFTMFIALLHYLNNYDDFNEFCTLNPNDHMRNFHNYSMEFLQEKIDEHFK